jgi:hypothetical protein
MLLILLASAPAVWMRFCRGAPFSWGQTILRTTPIAAAIVFVSDISHDGRLFRYMRVDKYLVIYTISFVLLLCISTFILRYDSDRWKEQPPRRPKPKMKAPS